MKRIVLSLFFLNKILCVSRLWGDRGSISQVSAFVLEQPFGMALFRNDLVISDRATGCSIRSLSPNKASSARLPCLATSPWGSRPTPTACG